MFGGSGKKKGDTLSIMMALENAATSSAMSGQGNVTGFDPDGLESQSS